MKLSIEKRAGTSTYPAVPKAERTVAETDRGLYEELCALGSQKMLPEAVSTPQAPAALSTCRLHPDIRPPAHPSLACLSFVIHHTLVHLSVITHLYSASTQAFIHPPVHLMPTKPLCLRPKNPSQLRFHQTKRPTCLEENPALSLAHKPRLCPAEVWLQSPVGTAVTWTRLLPSQGTFRSGLLSSLQRQGN